MKDVFINDKINCVKKNPVVVDIVVQAVLELITRRIVFTENFLEADPDNQNLGKHSTK